MSTVLLLSPPDQFGYFEDRIFQLTFATYLGLPCPMMAPVVGRYFEKNGVQLDKYGANLALAMLPGQGHRITHNNNSINPPINDETWRDTCRKGSRQLHHG